MPAVPPSRFGFLMTNYSYRLPSDRLFQRVMEMAQAAEATVFDTLYLPDHLVQGAVGDIDANLHEGQRTAQGPNGRTSPIFDAPTLLSALAVATTRVQLGPLVSPVTIRHPAVLAKIMTTIDVVSGGRVILGLGAGWDADEHQRYGIDYPATPERQDWLEDSVQICRAMFDAEAATFTGRHFSIRAAVNVPRPVSARIPILVGGVGPRTIRLAAHYADVYNPIGDGDSLRQAYGLLDQGLDEFGRSPAEVARIAGVMFHRLEDLYRQVEEAFDAGSEGVVLIPWQLALSPDDIAGIGAGLGTRFA